MCVHRTDYFVKFGNPDDLWPELQTQSYIFDYARSNPHPDAPRIPQVVHHFGDSMTMYLVMEFITLTAAPIDRTAQALVWLSSVPPPPNHVIGPLGGGCIRHKFRHLCFSQASRPYNGTCGRYVRAFIFSSIHRSLTCNLGQAYTLLSTQGQKQLSPVEISGDGLMFTSPTCTPATSASTSTGRRS